MEFEEEEEEEKTNPQQIKKPNQIKFNLPSNTQNNIQNNQINLQNQDNIEIEQNQQKNDHLKHQQQIKNNKNQNIFEKEEDEVDEEEQQITNNIFIDKQNLDQVQINELEEEYNNKLDDVTLENYFKKLQYRKQSIPVKILNRRHKKLQQLIEEDKFFSEEEIKLREPLLYFLYCGQYTRNNELLDDTQGLQCGMLTFLMQRNVEEEYQKILKKKYEKLKNKLDFPQLNSNQDIDQDEIEDNQDELIRLLHDRFICGLETEHFNYEFIDNNEDLDDDKIINDDIEESYYDKQQVLQIKLENSQYTGIQDY
ncbi:hypothetical protein PPERSA_01804 [Pseudocohnilembus persalinus]|uniref:CCD97-like C-terminal domain-containing protein n=1 Tax=Pseudocohnilembus persalinus TaxID=266149 RepID=A0A0V0QK48_PSEPJ|nr:hypothetical protein PPERSA_01804 [Pseudocohnilembus persalinus]|eukprot:KRX02687.1 hypothetical protein PPERSA_01804 [Pseudocohnilembus persalinus]